MCGAPATPSPSCISRSTATVRSWRVSRQSNSTPLVDQGRGDDSGDARPGFGPCIHAHFGRQGRGVPAASGGRRFHTAHRCRQRCGADVGQTHASRQHGDGVHVDRRRDLDGGGKRISRLAVHRLCRAGSDQPPRGRARGGDVRQLLDSAGTQSAAATIVAAGRMARLRCRQRRRVRCDPGSRRNVHRVRGGSRHLVDGGRVSFRPHGSLRRRRNHRPGGIADRDAIVDQGRGDDSLDAGSRRLTRWRWCRLPGARRFNAAPSPAA